MFQFRRFPSYAYFVQRRIMEYCSIGFPHSVIPGSMLMCSSPRLIAACHDLLRLLMPRHSPCALSSLTFSSRARFRWASLGLGWLSRIMQASDSVHCSFVVTLFQRSPQITLLPLCCLLAISCLLHCSVFKVQILTFFKVRLKCSLD